MNYQIKNREEQYQEAGSGGPYPDVGVLVVPGKIQHVVQSQHARRDLGEIHSWVDVVLRSRVRLRRRPFAVLRCKPGDGAFFFPAASGANVR